MLKSPDGQTRARARAALGRLLHRSRGPNLAPAPRSALSPGGLLRALLGALGVLGTLAAAGLITLLALLAHGPLSLERLSPQIAASLDERFGRRVSFHLGPSFFARTDEGLGFVLHGVDIRDATGRTILAAPEARIGFDPFSALILKLRVTRLELDSIDIRLRILGDGTFELAGAEQPGALAVAVPLAEGSALDATGAPLLGQIAAGVVKAMTGEAQTLDHIAINHGRLQIDNAKTQKKSVYENLSLNFERTAGAAEVLASANSKFGPFSFKIRAQDDGQLAVEGHDLSFNEVNFLGAAGAAVQSDAPVSFQLDMNSDHKGVLQSLVARFGLGAGKIKFGDKEEDSLRFDEVGGGMAWDAAAARFNFANLQYLAGQTHLAGAGWLAPPKAAGADWTSAFVASTAEFAPERAGDKPMAIADAHFQARYAPQNSRFSLDEFVLKGADIDVAATAASAMTEQGPTAKATLNVAHTGLAQALRVWPPLLLADQRQWCLQNLRGGEIIAGGLNLDWDAAALFAGLHDKPVPPDSVHGQFELRDTMVQFLPGLPAMSVPDASASFTGHEFKAQAKRGALELAAGRRVQASDINFGVPDTTPRALVPAVASAHLTGPADALPDLFARDALKTFAPLSIDPANVKGQFDGMLDVNLMLGKTARPSDIGFHTAGALTNLQIDKFIGAERLEQAALNFTADGDGLKIKGEGKILGAPASIDLAKAAGEEGAVTIGLALDNIAHARPGWNIGPGISGPVAVKIKAPLNKKSVDVEIDLSRVAIDNPIPGLVKPAGKAGKASFSLKSDAEGAHVSNLNIDVGAASAKGALELDNEGGFASAKLSQVRLTPGDDFRADIVMGEGAPKITVRGALLDARVFMKSLTERGLAPGAGGSFDLDMKLASAAGANRQTIKGFELLATRRDGVMSQLSAKGAVGEGAVTVQRKNGATQIRSSDAGALVKFFDLYPRMEGGQLDLEMKDAEGGQVGHAEVKDFVLRDEPALRQLVAAGQTQGVGADAAQVNASQVRFEKLTTQFTRTTGRVELRDAAIFNATMGLTTSGFIDYAQNRVDLNGIFVPAYQVNNLLTHLPLLGVLLGGGPHEGVFGVNYRIVGPASAPALKFNPLSAMTPGFLRKIFGALDGTSPASPPSAAQ